MLLDSEPLFPLPLFPVPLSGPNPVGRFVASAVGKKFTVIHSSGPYPCANTTHTCLYCRDVVANLAGWLASCPLSHSLSLFFSLPLGYLISVASVLGARRTTINGKIDVVGRIHHRVADRRTRIGEESKPTRRTRRRTLAKQTTNPCHYQSRRFTACVAVYVCVCVYVAGNNPMRRVIATHRGLDRSHFLFYFWVSSTLEERGGKGGYVRNSLQV